MSEWKKTASPTTAWGSTGSHHAALPLTESLCVTRHNLCLWSEWVREREVEMSALPQTCPLVWREEGFGCGRLIKVTAWIFRSESVLWICKWQSLCCCERTHTQYVHVCVCSCTNKMAPYGPNGAQGGTYTAPTECIKNHYNFSFIPLFAHTNQYWPNPIFCD